jgi:hypothetical protein
MSSVLSPFGATSSTSMSSGNVWLRLFSVAVMLVTSPAGSPETATFDGYVVAGPVPSPGTAVSSGGSAIPVELLNVSARAAGTAAPRNAHRKQVASAKRARVRIYTRLARFAIDRGAQTSG